MTELTTEVLRTLAPQDLAALLPAAVQIGEANAVVLRVAEPDLIEVYFAGRITAYGTKVLEIQPIADPAVREAALRNAVEALSICRHVAIQAHADQRRSHNELLEMIRQYAIVRHEEGDICREGLDDFLESFNLMPYEPRVRVEYTITGSYVVDSGGEAAAKEDAVKYLQPDLSGLDNVESESSTYDVSDINVSEV
ncbi:hypothetical protein [Streptomyces sp. TLI_146]|uniref:hypothetical protein n=1 Tax=Streptomyces sp. TLI_146 TaxID=1938858 RepID=UPI000C6FEF21|nr:hypothetical protein [Streptomyces sp. TLI_146]PKV88180.1 hypothetical protein BX283_5791 [Streptomyces sp. TLI_146]